MYQILAVPMEKVIPNDYNPNVMAPPEIALLYDSIREDGYTMPIVCYYDKERDLYIIVDGFHRWRVMKDYPDIYEREGGMLPVSVIDKPLSGRMAMQWNAPCLTLSYIIPNLCQKGNCMFFVFLGHTVHYSDKNR